MKEQSLNRRMLILMLLVTLVPVLLISAFYLYSYDRSFKQHQFELLSLIADKKTNQLNEYIGERIKDAQLTANSSAAREGLKRLTPLFQTRETHEVEYQQIQSIYNKELQYFLEHGFYDIFLVSLSWDIVSSIKAEEDLYSNLKTGPFAQTELAKQISKAFSLEEPSLSIFYYYQPSKELAAFIALPVLEHNQIVGVIALQLDLEKLKAIVEDRTGLGLSGESNIATVHNQVPFLKTRQDKKGGADSAGELLSIGLAMQLALMGDSGYSIVNDRFGNEVLAIRRYLPFLNAGLVVKIDTKEVFKELYVFWTLSFFLVIVVLSIVIYIAYVFSLSIVKPIVKLTKHTTAIAKGEEEYELIPEGVKETAQLARSFNLMREKIKHEKAMLECRVSERTDELSQKEQHLRLYREQSPVATIEWGINCQVVSWNRAAEEIFGYTLEEVQGLNFIELMVPETEKLQMLDIWNGLISDTGENRHINNNLTKGGSVITCEWYNTALKDDTGHVIGAASLVFDITEQQRISAVLHTLAETKGHDTKTIFQLIVQQLALSQNVRYALISQLNPKMPNDVETIAVWANGGLVDNFSYSLKGSPCEVVTQEGTCVYSDHIQTLFPEDRLLSDMEAVCYSGVLLRSIEGTPLGIIAILDDKVARKEPSTSKLMESLAVRAATELERKLAEEKLQFAARIYAETHEGIMLTDTNAVIVDVNPGFCTITGYSREEAIGQNASFLTSDKQSKSFYVQMWSTLKEQGSWRGEIWNRSKSGVLYAELLTISALVDENNQHINYVGLFSDITLAKKQQQSLERMAHYDVLTGLPNRVLFADRFVQAIAHSKRESSMLAICFIDLDEFKPVNDTYGHDVGDQVLIEVAARIKENIREQDTASRIGGDEFTLLLGDVHSIEQCKHAISRIHQAIAQPYVINNKSITIAASSGVTIYPLDNADLDTLIRHADSAMYQAKLLGRNRYHLFDSMEEQKIIQHHVQLKEIEQAFQRQEFSLYYQPKLNMLTGKVYGAEALIRWIHPDKGIIPPLDFLPYIEGTELEIQLGNWVMEQAFKQLNEWKQLNIQISINISSLHLQWGGFFEQVEKTLKLYPEIKSNLLQLEILESSILSDVHSISSIIKNLRDCLGVCIALDDFGTGYSSLTHLRRIPADTIKIDQSFVRDMLIDKSDCAIVEGIIVLSKTFNRGVIAEGVETKAHGVRLIELGCVYAQGYGIARPMPQEKFSLWLKDYQPYEEWKKGCNVADD